LIDPSPYQIRRGFNKESLQRLADDITTNGLLNPPLCRLVNDRYELMHGERRWRAVKLIPWNDIDVQVRDATDLEARRICTAENVHRLDLTPVEIIEATIEWIDASLYDEPRYLEFGDTAQERVKHLLVGLDSDNKHNTNYFGDKFVPKTQLAFKATNRNITWASFLHHDLRPYSNFHDDVKDVAVKHSLNKSQAKAAQKLKDKAPELFEEVKEAGTLEETPIEEVSARDMRRAVQHLKRKERSEAVCVKDVASEAKTPRLFIGRAEDMSFLDAGSVDLIITSPPYNLGKGNWPMGGEGRVPRENGIGYSDSLPESEYQAWQLACLCEMYRVAKQGASLFYNHKIRLKDGRMIHPMVWLGVAENPWIPRQELIWDRGSTHNHCPSLFWPHDERIYWLTKGKPTLPDRPIGVSTIWKSHGPIVSTWHPAPFSPEFPKFCLDAIGRPGITVLDPFAGSCTTLQVAVVEFGYDAIGVDINEKYLNRVAQEEQWTIENAT